MPVVIWLTGLPKSGKSSIAKEILKSFDAKYLRTQKFYKRILKKRMYNDEERTLIYSVLANEAQTLYQKGFSVVIDSTAHKKVWRDNLRTRIPNFVEVYVRCPLRICIKRDGEKTSSIVVSGLYKKALDRKDNIKSYPDLGDVVGIDVKYEPNENAEVVVDSHLISVQESSKLVLKYLKDSGIKLHQ